MKKAIIFHGTAAHPHVLWLPWLKKNLEEAGFSVAVPSYPEMNREDISTFLPKVLANHTFTEETVLIGHSGGAAFLLSLLEHIDVKVKQAILVAGYMTNPNGEDQPVLQDTYDWEKIKSHVRDIYFINSITDPYNCDEKQGRMMFDHLGGTLIIRDEGHFGSEDQDYKEFPLLLRLIA